MKIKTKQHANPLTKGGVDRLDHVVIAIPAAKTLRAWPSFPYADVLKQRYQRAGRNGDSNPPLTTELPNRPGTRVTLATVAQDADSFTLLGLARRLVAPHLEDDPAALTVLCAGLEAAPAARIANAVAAAAAAATAEMPSFKRQAGKPKRLRTLDYFGLPAKVDFSRTLAAAEGNNLARRLTALPPNRLTPALYRAEIERLAGEMGWDMEFLDLEALAARNAGAFLAVAQGSEERDAGIAHLRYRPRAARKAAPLALVGKGICYDTGGTNLKPAKFMFGMHEDMEGSAVALGTLLALTRLQVHFPVDCWLALAQNHIGPRAYKQNDVVTAGNGLSIEVVHTDAEGRMVLADTLVLAGGERPALMLDFATLTGACVYALGTAYSGAFTNRPALIPGIMAAGASSGERVWPFPQDEDYDEALKSDIADVKQCTIEGEADHILGARFLSRFVDKAVPWVHIDLSAGSRKGGLAHIPTDVTGFGVRFALDFVLDGDAMRGAAPA